MKRGRKNRLLLAALCPDRGYLPSFPHLRNLSCAGGLWRYFEGGGGGGGGGGEPGDPDSFHLFDGRLCCVLSGRHSRLRPGPVRAKNSLENFASIVVFRRFCALLCRMPYFSKRLEVSWPLVCSLARKGKEERRKGDEHAASAFLANFLFPALEESDLASGEEGREERENLPVGVPSGARLTAESRKEGRKRRRASGTRHHDGLRLRPHLLVHVPLLSSVCALRRRSPRARQQKKEERGEGKIFLGDESLAFGSLPRPAVEVLALRHAHELLVIVGAVHHFGGEKRKQKKEKGGGGKERR